MSWAAVKLEYKNIMENNYGNVESYKPREVDHK